MKLQLHYVLIPGTSLLWLLLSVYSKRNHALLGLAVMIVLLSQVAIMHFLKSSNVTLTSAIKRTRKVKEIRVRADRK